MFKSIKGKLIFYFTAVFVSLSLVLCLYFFRVSYQKYRTEMIQNTQSNISYFQSNINRMLEQCEMLSDKIYFNRNITKVLLRNYSGASNQNLDRDIYDALNDVSAYLDNDILAKYVTSIIISGKNGQVLTYGEDAPYLRQEDYEGEEWFQLSKTNTTAVWLPIIESTSRMTTTSEFLPIVRQCISSDGRKAIGWQFIAVSTKLISDLVEGFNFRKDDVLLITDNRGRCVYCNRSGIGEDEQNEIISQMGDAAGKSIHYDGMEWIPVQIHSDYSNLTIVQLVNYGYFREQGVLLFKSTIGIIVISVIVIVLMTILLSHILTRPIMQIVRKMELIAQGDFSVDKELEGDNEIGTLGKGINQLAQDVENLMVRVREEERQKREYEYKTLQSQINPHFVYNMLNSIKIMAQLQGAGNICTMIENFGGLLKEVSKGIDDMVPVSKEFELAEKYVCLQRIRKKGLLHADYQIESGCEECLMLKFLLQPLIENSVIHGLETKKGMGHLWIRAGIADDKLRITIRDDGLGMTAGEIDALYKTENKETAGQYNKIGVRNVHERIQLLYGSEFGLHYESVKEEYTLVAVDLPIIKNTGTEKMIEQD